METPTHIEVSKVSLCNISLHNGAPNRLLYSPIHGGIISVEIPSRHMSLHCVNGNSFSDALSQQTEKWGSMVFLALNLMKKK